MLTTAFETAAKLRAETLGLGRHPLVVMQHPLASRSGVEVQAIAADLIASVARVLTEAP